MSSKIKGLRRVGIVGLSTIVAASMMTLSGVSASAAAGAYVAATTPNVVQGTSPAAGVVSLDFANSFVAGTQTFQIKRGAVANNCTTPAGVAAAIDFASASAAVTGPFLADGVTAGDTTSTKPTVGTITFTGSSAACTANGVLDVANVPTSPASVGVATDTFRIALTASYVVPGTAAAGPVALVTAGNLFAGPATVNNANVVAVSNTSMPVATVQTQSLGNTLGTVTFVETTSGTYFTGSTNVILTLTGDAVFTAGVTPTITAPAGYTVSGAAFTATGGTGKSFEFNVLAPATPTILATVTVAGLKIDSNDTDGSLVTLSTDTATGAAAATINAAKILDYNDRTFGADRYGTAARLFANQFGASVASPKVKATAVVLSSGLDFPDALSANYLAGQLTPKTGILLTKPSVLAPEAKAQILNGTVTTVYITGREGAVSTPVQAQIEAMHVGNDPAKPFITVNRLGGLGRYETNRIINEDTFVAKNTVLMASGEDFPDALALGPIAAHLGFPLILTKGKVLGANELTQLADFAPTNVVIAGGVGVVSKAIADDLTLKGYTVTRLDGVGRTETAQKVASWATSSTATPTHAPFSSGTTYIARGDDFADALAAGPVAGINNNVVVLTKSLTTLGDGIPAYLSTKTVVAGNAATHVDILHALGGSSVVPVSIMRAAAVTVGP